MPKPMPIDETCTNIDGKQNQNEKKNYEKFVVGKVHRKFSVVDDVVELRWFNSNTCVRVCIFRNVVQDFDLCVLDMRLKNFPLARAPRNKSMHTQPSSEFSFFYFTADAATVNIAAAAAVFLFLQ